MGSRTVLFKSAIAVLHISEWVRCLRSPDLAICEMMQELRLFRCTKLVISGILNLFDRGSCVMTATRIEFYRRDSEIAASKPGIILCPMYLVRSLPARN